MQEDGRNRSEGPGRKELERVKQFPCEFFPNNLHEFDEFPNFRKTSMILQPWMNVVMKRLPASMNGRCVTKPGKCHLS
jgi:hypothetical protein